MCTCVYPKDIPIYAMTLCRHMKHVYYCTLVEFLSAVERMDSKRWNRSRSRRKKGREERGEQGEKTEEEDAGGEKRKMRDWKGTEIKRSRRSRKLLIWSLLMRRNREKRGAEVGGKKSGTERRGAGRGGRRWGEVGKGGAGGRKGRRIEGRWITRKER